MGDLLKIDLTYSNYHTIFPKFVIYFLILLGILLIIKTIVNKIKLKKAVDENRTDYQENAEEKTKGKFNITMFVGSIILLILYGLALGWFGFLYTTIIFVILSTLLYIGKMNKKAFLVSISNAVATSIIIWLVFGKLFDITLP